MLDHPDLGTFDLSSLRLAVTGAAPVSVELVRRMREELQFDTVVTGYGLTESTGIVTMCRHDDPTETIAHTAGRAIPGVEVRLVDDDRQRRRHRRAGRAVGPRLQRHGRLLRQPRSHRRDHHRRRLAAHRRHRRAGRRGQRAHHRPAEGHVHQRRVQRVPRRDRERARRLPGCQPGRP